MCGCPDKLRLLDESLQEMNERYRLSIIRREEFKVEVLNWEALVAENLAIIKYLQAKHLEINNAHANLCKC
jgi:hypothetical protein